MNAYVSFRVRSEDVNSVHEWLAENKLTDYTTYSWVDRILTFERKEDAVAFSLTFCLQKFNTTLDKMLQDEESND